MAESSPKESRIVVFVTKNGNQICVVCYILGVLGFLALPFREFSENHYHSENALLIGLQDSNYGWYEANNADRLNEMIRETGKNEGISGVQEHLIQIMEEYGMTAYRQNFVIKSPLPDTVKGELQHQTRNGTNIYGFIRAGRAASTESIVLNVPISGDGHNYAIGLALSFGSKIRTQPYWAKDIVLLFTEMGSVGAQAWLQSYLDVKSSDLIQAELLKERAGTVLAALNLELPESSSYLNAEVVGNNGQLPNLDVFNIVRKLCLGAGFRLAVGGILSRNQFEASPVKNYMEALKMTVKMMSKQAKGFSDINHAVFLQYNIQSLTIQGIHSRRNKAMQNVDIGRVVEGIFRSLNNLLEKLHHSYFFYLISATDRFISIVLYMPPFGLILLAPTLKALCLWLKIRQDQEKEEEKRESSSSAEEEENDAIEDLIERDRKQIPEDIRHQEVEESAWMEVFYILAIAHLIGVVLYYSPLAAPSWSAMYNLNAEDSLVLIFLSTYSLALPLPFTSFFRFSEEPKVFDLLRVVALVLFAMILGCTAVMNFSLGMVFAAASVPLITPISSHAKRLKPIFIPMALLASPVIIALLTTYGNQYCFNVKAGNFWNSAKNIVKIPYEQSLLGNSWNYELACLLLYPNWMLFWFLAVFGTKEKKL